MSLDEIDHVAILARLDAITTSGLRALAECTRRSAEIDKRVQEMHARQERATRSMNELVEQSTKARQPAPPARPNRPARLR
jgi:RNA processing factor Prp31